MKARPSDVEAAPPRPVSKPPPPFGFHAALLESGLVTGEAMPDKWGSELEKGDLVFWQSPIVDWSGSQDSASIVRVVDVFDDRYVVEFMAADDRAELEYPQGPQAFVDRANRLFDEISTTLDESGIGARKSATGVRVRGPWLGIGAHSGRAAHTEGSHDPPFEEVEVHFELIPTPRLRNRRSLVAHGGDLRPSPSEGRPSSLIRE